MKKISSRSRLSSSSSALLLGLQGVWHQEEFSLWLPQQGMCVLFLSQGSRQRGPGAAIGLIDPTRSKREASYREGSCWIGDMAVVASTLLLPINPGDTAASFLGPEVVPFLDLVPSLLVCIRGLCPSSMFAPKPTIFFPELLPRLLPGFLEFLLTGGVLSK